MSLVFGNDEARVKLYIPKGTADWSIESVMKKDEFSNMVLISFSLSDLETIDVRRCFNETTHIFAFGRNIQEHVLDMSFLFFLNDGCKKKSGSWLKLNELNKKYSDARIYKKLKPLKLVVDDYTTYGYLIQLAVGNLDPVHKTAVVTFKFILDEEV